MSGFGKLMVQLRAMSGLWRSLFFAGLAGLVALNVFVHPHHPHVEAETVIGFWPVFGLGVAVGLAFVAKVILANVLDVSEDFYDE